MKTLFTIVLLLALCQIALGQQPKKLQFYWATDGITKISTDLPARAWESTIVLPKSSFTIPYNWQKSDVEVNFVFSYKEVQKREDSKKYGYLFNATKSKWQLFYVYKDEKYYYDPNFVNKNTKL